MHMYHTAMCVYVYPSITILNAFYTSISIYLDTSAILLYCYTNTTDILAYTIHILYIPRSDSRTDDELARVITGGQYTGTTNSNNNTTNFTSSTMTRGSRSASVVDARGNAHSSLDMSTVISPLAAHLPAHTGTNLADHV